MKRKKRVVPQNNKLNSNCRRRKECTWRPKTEMRVYKGRVFIRRNRKWWRGRGGCRCTGCRYWKTEKRTVRRGNICQTHIFSDLSRPRFPKSQFNFPAVATIARLSRGRCAYTRNILQITRVIFYKKHIYSLLNKMFLNKKT